MSALSFRIRIALALLLTLAPPAGAQQDQGIITTGGVLGASSRLINNWPVYRQVTVRSTPT